MIAIERRVLVDCFARNLLSQGLLFIDERVGLLNADQFVRCTRLRGDEGIQFQHERRRIDFLRVGNNENHQERND